MTRHQRIASLKKKTMQYESAKKTSANTNQTLITCWKNTCNVISESVLNGGTPSTDENTAIVVTQTTSEGYEAPKDQQSVPIANHDAFFEDTQSNQQAVLISNHDAFFEEKLDSRLHRSQNESEEIQSNRRSFTNEMQMEFPKAANKAQNQNPLLGPPRIEQHKTGNSQEEVSNWNISLLLERFDQLKDSFELLRRQVARIEAKSSNNVGVTQATHSVGIDAYLDLNASLATEGLPIRNCEGVGVLENKLKNSSYKQRLVSNVKSKRHAYCFNLILVSTKCGNNILYSSTDWLVGYH